MRSAMGMPTKSSLPRWRCAACRWGKRPAPSPPMTCAGPVTCSGPSTTPPAGWAARCPSRWTRGSPGTPPKPAPGPRPRWGGWTGPTPSSRSPPPAARRQRPLWASTSTKDPASPDTMCVVELVAPNTANTMPEATILAVADHGELRGNTVHGTYEQSKKVFEELAALGIGYEDVVTVLEEEGVSKFAASWQGLLETIQAELERQ